MKNNKTSIVSQDYNVLVGGAAGEGSRMAGLTIAKFLSNYGWRVSITEDYQSLIKGGHNFSIIRATKQRNASAKKTVDFLIALNKHTFEKHLSSLDKDGIVIYNSDVSEYEHGFGLSAKEITETFKCAPIMKNSAFLGAFAKVIGMDFSVLEEVFKKEISKEYEANVAIARYGYDKVDTLEKIEKLKQTPLPLITGNEALALGAVKAGMKAYYAYPMTPATNILHFLAKNTKEFDTKVVQLENEIAVINAGMASASAGLRTMVGTSGGGLALMAEGISCCAQGEIPMVIVNSQRTGPATGVPTYGGQCDLDFCRGIGHGDFTRLILAPGNAEESYLLGAMAVNYAWKYQIPVMVLTDKDVSEGTYDFDPKIIDKVKIEKELKWDGKGEYQRYANTKNGISPMAYFGDNAVIKITSYEHGENGITAEEDEKEINMMQEKRLKKFALLEKDIQKIKSVNVYGNKNSKTAILAWGCVTGVAKEAAEALGIKLIQPTILTPFPKKQIEIALKGVKNLIAVEMGAVGQLANLFVDNGIKVDSRILKYSGRQFFVEELISQLKSKIKR
jgi:2-oxoglutarate ferredoxin oxidoreductase subunit alpha